MVPFVAGVLSGMALQKALGNATDEKPIFEPVEMREVTEEYVNDILSKSSKQQQISAREVSDDELPQYIRDKLAARANSSIAEE